jgi:hypothetical protein
MKRRQFLEKAAIGSGTLASLALLPDEARAERHHEGLEGTWNVTFFFTLPAGFPPGKALYTFAKGGTFVMTANNADPRVIGPGHGAWTKTGDDEFGLTFIRMRFDPTTNPPRYLGTLKVRAAPLRLNDAGDEWTNDRFVGDFYDPEGNFILRAFEGTAQAERVAVEQPDE